MSLETSLNDTVQRGTGVAKTAVINVLSHEPGYDLLSDQNGFLKSWTGPSGQLVGIVNREWPGDLGRWVLCATERYGWEVWQPDTRAVCTYAHQFSDGVVHRIFPAQQHVFRPGLFRPVAGLVAPTLVARQAALNDAIVVLHGFEAPWWGELVDRFGSRLPIVMVAHGTARPLVRRLGTARHPLTVPALIVDYVRTRQRYARLAAVTAPNETTMSGIRGVYRGPLQRLTMGCDFDFWTPAEPAAREAIRRSFGIQANQTVFITAAYLRPVKQVDRLIQACLALGQRDDYALLVVGQGDREYMRALEGVGRPLGANRRLVFYPYQTLEALRRLYWAADAYVCASRAEGASVSVMEAMACGLPVISTPVGGTYELMRDTGSGAILPAHRFNHWPRVLSDVLTMGLPPVTNRYIARAHYHWPNIAHRFAALLDEAARAFNRRTRVA